MESSVYYFFHGDFVDVDLFESRLYIHLVKGSHEECLFDHTEAPACKRAAVQPIHGTEVDN